MDFTLLTDPSRFFARRAEEPSLLPPALVVFVAALVSAVTGALYGQQLIAVLPDSVRAAGVVFIIVSAGGAFIAPFVGWLIATAVFYGISALFDGEGEFADLLAFVGWGYAPAILSGVVSLVITILVFQSFSFPSDPQSMGSAIRQYQNMPLVQLSSVLGIVFTLWQAFIWTFGVEYARNLSRRDAAITVGVPIGVLVLWNVYNLI